MKNQLSVIVSKLLTNAKIPFDKNELSFQIQSHPSYPSLHSITGVLDHFNIENIAANIPINIETLKQLPSNFIAQLNDDNGQSLVNVNVSKEDYTVISNGNKKEKLNAKQFLEKFTGIIVAVEKPERTESNISSKRQIRNFLIVQSPLLFLSDFVVYNLGLTEIVLFITIAFAVILSWIYLKPMLFEVNKHRKEKINFLKFQRNFDVFNTMLNKANTFNTKIDTIEEITLGNLNAKLEIVVITNPFCGTVNLYTRL